MAVVARLTSALTRHASASGIGLAGVSGVFASALTDIASALGPFLPAFFVLSAAAAIFAAINVYRAETVFEKTATEPKGAGFYCKSLLILIGALIGSGVLLITGMLNPESEGSAILATLNGLRGDIQEVGSKVDEVGSQVEAVDEQVSGIGQVVSIRDISGRSGTAMIGDVAVFNISLANKKLMDGARCALSLSGDWREKISIEDKDCANFSVAMPKSPILDAAGQSAGDIVSIPFVITVSNKKGEPLGVYDDVYPFYNNYRTVALELDPPGNRFKIGERRRVVVTAGEGAALGEGVQCDWSLSPHLDGVSFIPDSDDHCAGWLSTELDDDSYVPRRIDSEGGRLRARVSVAVVTQADFHMLGIMETQLQVSK